MANFQFLPSVPLWHSVKRWHNYLGCCWVMCSLSNHLSFNYALFSQREWFLGAGRKASENVYGFLRGCCSEKGWNDFMPSIVGGLGNECTLSISCCRYIGKLILRHCVWQALQTTQLQSLQIIHRPWLRCHGYWLAIIHPSFHARIISLEGALRQYM